MKRQPRCPWLLCSSLIERSHRFAEAKRILDLSIGRSNNQNQFGVELHSWQQIRQALLNSHHFAETLQAAARMFHFRSSLSERRRQTRIAELRNTAQLRLLRFGSRVHRGEQFEKQSVRCERRWLRSRMMNRVSRQSCVKFSLQVSFNPLEPTNLNRQTQSIKQIRHLRAAARQSL